MGAKKVLVVYYSRTGTTKKVAESIASALGADVEEVVDLKKRDGMTGFMRGGRDATFKKLTDIGAAVKDPSAYDLVAVGTPVWAWTMCPAIRTYLTKEKERLPKVAFFLTTGGTGIERTFEHMGELCGRPAVATLGLKAAEVTGGGFEGRVSEFVAALEK